MEQRGLADQVAAMRGAVNAVLAFRRDPTNKIACLALASAMERRDRAFDVFGPASDGRFGPDCQAWQRVQDAMYRIVATKANRA